MGNVFHEYKPVNEYVEAHDHLLERREYVFLNLLPFSIPNLLFSCFSFYMEMVQ